MSHIYVNMCWFELDAEVQAEIHVDFGLRHQRFGARGGGLITPHQSRGELALLNLKSKQRYILQRDASFLPWIHQEHF